MQGKIEVSGKLTGKLSAIGALSGRLSIPDQIQGEQYAGETEVIPKWQEQQLPTADKLVTRDIIVHKIPVYETSNPSGGTTVIIGG